VPGRFVPLATIGAPHGVRGELRVKSFTAEPAALGDYGTLRARDGRAFEIERLRPLKDDMLVVKLRGVADRDAAARLTGTVIGVARDAFPAPEEDEFYLADLIGLAVVDAAGRPAGRVTNLYNHGAGDIIEVAPEGGGRSALLPFTRAVVPEVDIAAGRIVVVPPDEIEARPESEDEREED
jgi:16S rRNA processing protein RimM